MKPPEAPRQEREVEFAEFEVRIRQFSAELLQPTVRKVSHLEQEQANLKSEAQRNGVQIAELVKTSVKVDQQVATVEGFQEELGRWDNERRQHQAEAAEAVSGMRQELHNFRYQLERQDCSIHSIQRTVDRVVGELSKLQECSDSLRQFVQTRLEQQGKTLNTKTIDLEVKLVSLEARHNRLSDDLWGEETGLAKVTHNLAKTDDLVGAHSAELKRMRQELAGKPQLEAVQLEVNNLKHEANNNILVLQETVNTMIGNVKSHFETATQTVAVQNATMMEAVRGSYQEELNQSAELRTEIKTFMQDAQHKMAHLEKTFARLQETTGEMVKKVSGDLDEANKVRRRDRNNDEITTKSMQEQLTGISSASETASRNLEHLSSVIWMLLQSERAGSALDQQDASDRTKVALMGYRDGPPHAGPSRHAGSARPPAIAGCTPRSRARSHGASAAGHASIAGNSVQGSKSHSAIEDAGPVISVDHRCLSCSGQAQTVLSGFKMACLEYTPGPVTFARQTYDRGDLLDKRAKLLSQAHEALEHGPIRFSQSDPFSGTKDHLFGTRDSSPRTGTTGSEGNSQRDDRTESRSSMASTSAPTQSLPPLSARMTASR